ncbi:MAG: tyrosine-type recombinase/integrase [Clostridium sp.]|uniref:tyrosine-type recombinase/integrase n=1 Tax=Clostridia TaxID=186801 RepID=UPI000A027B6B|nr:tyrosine-type recombinase/integrase [Clostridium sp. D5]MDU7705829.1 tyrosine-type recombinase/integrase [Clostridium sp.]MEE0201108.1 tyrosine-type recombinase/integrase [Muricomes sp.]
MLLALAAEKSAFFTGLRISEFCGLTIRVLDFENRIINVPRVRRIKNAATPLRTTALLSPI